MRFLYILVLIGGVCSSFAQEPPLTLKRALEVTVERHPRLLALRHDIQAARYRIQSASALHNPLLKVVPEFSAGGSDNALLLEQPLELNGTRRARVRIARAEQEQVYQQSLAEGSLLLAQVQTAYFELVRARQMRLLQEELLQLLTEAEQLTRRMVELGARAGVEQMQIEIERLRQQQAFTQALSEERQALTQLNQWLMQDSQHPVELASLVAKSDDTDMPATFASPEALREQAIGQQLLAERAWQRSQSLPEVFLQGRWERFSSHTRPGLAIGLSLPLLDYGARRNRFKEFDQQIQAQSERIDAIQRQVNTTRAQARERLQTAQESMHSYESGILEKAKRLLEAQQKGYALGQTDLLHLLEAQRVYKAVQLDYLNAQAAYWRELTGYQHATGAFLPLCETFLQTPKHTLQEEQK
jgi:outer membrane protein TolC